METKVRRMLHSLVLPIYTQIEGERNVRAEMQAIYEKLMERLETVEQLLGSSNNKPKMIEDIENEMALIRCNHAEFETEIRNDLKLTKQEFSRLKQLMDDQTIQMKAVR